MNVLCRLAPPYWIQEPEDIETIEGTSVNLKCFAKGTPEPRIHWSKFGKFSKSLYIFVQFYYNCLNNLSYLYVIVSK